MDDLNNFLVQLNVRPSLFQDCKSQEPRDFHLFLNLPFEIRELIWKFSLPDTIRVRTIMPEDGHLYLQYHNN